jgi:hypothetical protein
MNEAEIKTVVEKLCSYAVTYGKKVKKPLDMSLKSVVNLEKILDFFCKDLYCGPLKAFIRKIRKNELTESHVTSMSKILGTYLGELIRIKLGKDCKWKDIDETGKEVELYLTYKELKIYPIEKALNRLIKGREDNIVHYYNSFKIIN